MYIYNICFIEYRSIFMFLYSEKQKGEYEHLPPPLRVNYLLIVASIYSLLVVNSYWEEFYEWSQVVLEQLPTPLNIGSLYTPLK